jgi:hypothetical protein
LTGENKQALIELRKRLEIQVYSDFFADRDLDSSTLGGSSVESLFQSLRNRKGVSDQLVEDLVKYYRLTKKSDQDFTPAEFNSILATGYEVLNAIHNQGVITRLLYDFDGHGLWHIIKKEKLNRKDAISRFVEILPMAEYNYELLTTAIQIHNSHDRGGHQILQLTLIEFLELIKFRISEVMRAKNLLVEKYGANIDASEKIPYTYNFHRDCEWAWPNHWGEISWNSQVLTSVFQHTPQMAINIDVKNAATALYYYKNKVGQLEHSI